MAHFDNSRTKFLHFARRTHWVSQSERQMSGEIVLNILILNVLYSRMFTGNTYLESIVNYNCNKFQFVISLILMSLYRLDEGRTMQKTSDLKSDHKPIYHKPRKLYIHFMEVSAHF